MNDSGNPHSPPPAPAALEQELRRHKDEVEALSSELEAFTYSISHDLRTPLRGMIGYLGALRQDTGPSLSPEGASYVARAIQCAERMQSLVDDLLRLSRVGRQEIHLLATPLRNLVGQVIAALPPETPARAIEWRLGELPKVACDPILVRQVFEHLISNALKFTRSRPRAVITVEAVVREGETVFVVRDNGVGFDPQHAANLFTPFARMHPADEFEGNGIGLALASRILRRHGGRIWAEAAIDQGASFYFTLGGGA